MRAGHWLVDNSERLGVSSETCLMSTLAGPRPNHSPLVQFRGFPVSGLHSLSASSLSHLLPRIPPSLAISCLKPSTCPQSEKTKSFRIKVIIAGLTVVMNLTRKTKHQEECQCYLNPPKTSSQFIHALSVTTSSTGSSLLLLLRKL